MSSSSLTETLKTARIYLLIQISVAVIPSLIALCVFSQTVAMSFAMGAGLTTFSFVSIGATLYWVFFKKSIALLVGVIVFKWPILIYAVIWFMGQYQVDYGAFALGSMVWLPAGIIWHFIANRD